MALLYPGQSTKEIQHVLFFAYDRKKWEILPQDLLQFQPSVLGGESGIREGIEFRDQDGLVRIKLKNPIQIQSSSHDRIEPFPFPLTRTPISPAFILRDFQGSWSVACCQNCPNQTPYSCQFCSFKGSKSWHPYPQATLTLFYGQRVLRHVKMVPHKKEKAAFWLLFLFFPPPCQEKIIFFSCVGI